MTMINIILIALFLIFSIYLYNSSRSYFPFLIPIWFMHTWMLLSVAYLEDGVNIANHNTLTYYTGATFRLVILEIAFFVSVLIGLKIFKKHKKKQYNLVIKNWNKERVMNLWLLIIYVASCILLIDMIISGNKLTNTSITRFNFYKEYSKLSLITWPISLFIDFLQCISGMLYVEYKKNDNRNKKYACIMALLAGLIYKYLMGVEFGGYFYMLVLFICPIFVDYKRKKIRVFSVRNITLILIALILIITPKITFFKNNSSVYSSVSDKPFDKFKYRALALQGEVWWGVDNKYINNQIDSKNQVQNEIDAFIDDENRFSSGIWFLSNLILPQYDHINNNATLNCGYPAINVAIFGYTGALILQFFNGIVFSMSIVYLHNKVVNKQFLRAFFACGMWFMLYNSFYMGGLWYLGGATMKISLFSIIGIEIIIRIININRIKKI